MTIHPHRLLIGFRGSKQSVATATDVVNVVFTNGVTV